MNMLTTEWNWDVAREVWEEEAREEAREETRKEIFELLEQGYTLEQIKAKLAAAKSDRTETEST